MGRACPATAGRGVRGALPGDQLFCKSHGVPFSQTMAAFILRRLGQAVLVMLTVGLIAFALFRFVGDPVIFMLGQDATPEDRARVTQLLGLDRPFYVQYAAFVSNALHGQFGLSLRQVRPVSALIVERLPATLELSLHGGALRARGRHPDGRVHGAETEFVAVAPCCSASRSPACRCRPS